MNNGREKTTTLGKEEHGRQREEQMQRPCGRSECDQQRKDGSQHSWNAVKNGLRAAQSRTMKDAKGQREEERIIITSRTDFQKWALQTSLS